MDLSVVVVTFNSAACIELCLESVRRHLPTAEIVVVDNASGDATPEILQGHPDVGFVANVRNDGFGRACNLGAQEATSGHLLFLNPDVVVTHCDSEGLGQLLGAEPFGLVGPDSTEAQGLMGVQIEAHFLHDWFEQTLGTLRPREWRRPRRRPEPPHGDAWLSGSMLLARRTEFHRLGGFDPRFFLYYEDRDLAARYRQSGLPIRVTTVLEGAHAESGSSGSDDLRVVPAGWAFLSWIEYVFLHRGERTARLTARSGVATLQALRLALTGVAKVAPKHRVVRKRTQLEGVLEFLDEQAAQPIIDDGSFCPDARRLLATAR